MQKDKDEFEAKLAEQQAELAKKQAENEMLKNTPHLKNINSDPAMTGMFKKAMAEGENVIGK